MRSNGPLTRYVKLWAAHAPGKPGTFSPPTDFKINRWLAIPTCITARAWHVPWCMSWRLPAVVGKFYVSGKRPMAFNGKLTYSAQNITYENMFDFTFETFDDVISYRHILAPGEPWYMGASWVLSDVKPYLCTVRTASNYLLNTF